MAFKRHRWMIPLVALAVVIGVAVTLRTLLQPERLSDFLLRKAQDATGLELSLQKPADIGLWPDLHVELTGLTARVPGAPRPLLTTARLEARLPWSTLRGEEINLLGVRLISPRLDLPALLALLDHDADIGPPAPLQLPGLDAPLEIHEGRIDGDGWTIDALNLSLRSLHDGQPTELNVRGRLASGDGDLRFAFQLLTTPRTQGPALRLDPMVLDLVLDGTSMQHPHIEGWLEWNPAGSLALALSSRFEPWPAEWPVLPFPGSDQEPVELSLAYSGDSAFTGPARFSLQRGEEGARGTLTLNDTLLWLGNSRYSPLPPAAGEITSERIEIDGIQASGIRLRLQPDDGTDAASD